MNFTTYIVAGAVLISGGLPLIPEEMELFYSYKDDCLYELPVDATSTIPQDPRPYIPDCTVGEYAVSVFSDHKGNNVYIEIPVEKYHELGRKDGYLKNPKKEEHLTLFESLVLLTPVVEAAIAGNSTTSDPEQVVASSITFAATTTSPNAGLVVSANMNDAADTCRTASYNGVAMTYVDETSYVSGPRVERLSAFYNIATTTGTFNVVVTCTGSITHGLDVKALTYTGVHQTEMLNTYSKYHSNGASTSTISTNVITTVDGTWSVSGLRNANGPMTDDTLCDVKTTDGASICDSNASVGVAGQYQTQVTTAFAGPMAMVTLFIAPASEASPESTTTPILIMEGDVILQGDTIITY